MTAATPLVSVVLPTYNAASTLTDAVMSILEQQLREIELIIVDDGSTDGTDRVLAGIDDPRLVILHHPANLGYVAALGTAIDHATAPIVARMDADDIAHPDRLARQYEILRRRPSVGLVSTAFVSVDPDGRQLRQHGVPPDHAAAWFRLHFANCLAHPTVMYRRTAYDAVGGYDQRAVPADDHDLWLRMAEVVEIATIPDPLLRYRRSPESMSARLEDAMARASVSVSARAIERTVGRRPPERILKGLRVADPILGCSDAAAVLDVVVPVYTAIDRACAARGIPTKTLPGQLAALLIIGGLRAPDTTWCRSGLAHLVRHHPRAAATLARDRAIARIRHAIAGADG